MKNLREGITTGSCAAAAALAAAIWQKTGSCPAAVEIETPIGRILRIPVEKASANQIGTCFVIKDSGDDPDITNGCRVEAMVEFLKGQEGKILIEGGAGIGIVMEKGLKVPVGEWAINPIPRQMIQKELSKVIGNQNLRVTISIPNGEELAKKTLNPKLGIKGGLSILGTTGIVRPMSKEALKDSLVLELKMRREQGAKTIIFVPGMAGERMVQNYLKMELPIIHIGNYVGFMLEEASELGYESVILAGAAGKLLKLAAGIMNTYSHIADGRREVLCTYAALSGATKQIIQELYHCVTTESAMALLERENLMGIWQDIAQEGARHCIIRGGYKINIRIILFKQNGKVLADCKQEIQE